MKIETLKKGFLQKKLMRLRSLAGERRTEDPVAACSNHAEGSTFLLFLPFSCRYV